MNPDVFDLADDRYAAQVMPELFPGEPQPVLSHWPEEDREMYCGIYTVPRLVAVRAAAQQDGTIRVGHWPLVS